MTTREDGGSGSHCITTDVTEVKGMECNPVTVFSDVA